MNGTIDQIQALLQQIMEEYPNRPRVQTICKGMSSLCAMLHEAVGSEDRSV